MSNAAELRRGMTVLWGVAGEWAADTITTKLTEEHRGRVRATGGRG